MADDASELTVIAFIGHLKGWGWSRDRYQGCLACFAALGALAKQKGVGPQQNPTFDSDISRGILEFARLGRSDLLISFCHKNRGLEWYRLAAEALGEIRDVRGLELLSHHGSKDEREFPIKVLGAIKREASKMSAMEIGVLLVRYSELAIEEREEFLHEHPQLKDKAVILWALTAGKLRGRMGDTQAEGRYASAAFHLAAELNDHEMGAEAADVLANVSEKVGQAQFADQWRVVSQRLRLGIEPIPNRPALKESDGVGSRAASKEQPKFCTQCGCPILDGAAFCTSCRTHEADMSRPMVTAWDYKEVRIPLGIEGRVPANGADQAGAARQAAIEFGSRANNRIMAALQEQGTSGWQPDGSTDLLSLFLAGRVSWRQTGGILFSWKFRFDSVVIRFKRMT